jgi:hypothetical protein
VQVLLSHLEALEIMWRALFINCTKINKMAISQTEWSDHLFLAPEVHGLNFFISISSVNF